MVSLQELLTESHFKAYPDLDEVPGHIRIIHKKLPGPEEALLIRLNIKYEYNIIEKFDLEDWRNHGDEEKEKLVKLIGQLFDTNIFKKQTIENIIKGNFPDEIKYTSKELDFVRKYVVDIANPNEAARELIEISNKARYRAATKITKIEGEGKIVHAPKHSSWAERRLFGDTDLMDEEELNNIEIDFEQLWKHEPLAKIFRAGLNPKTVGEIKVGFKIIFPGKGVFEQQEKALELDIKEEGGAKDLLEHYRTMRDEVWYIVTLEYASFDPRHDFPYESRVEKQPEWKEDPEKQMKPKFEGYDHPTNPHITEEGKKVSGHLEAGGAQTHISTKSSTMLYYIKKQVARLKRILNG